MPPFTRFVILCVCVCVCVCLHALSSLISLLHERMCGGGGRVYVFERAAAAAPDRPQLVLYLRIVHSYDFFSATEFEIENELAHRWVSVPPCMRSTACPCPFVVDDVTHSLSPVSAC
jgi:hypothetical protein